MMHHAASRVSLETADTKATYWHASGLPDRLFSHCLCPFHVIEKAPLPEQGGFIEYARLRI